MKFGQYLYTLLALIELPIGIDTKKSSTPILGLIQKFTAISGVTKVSLALGLTMHTH